MLHHSWAVHADSRTQLTSASGAKGLCRCTGLLLSLHEAVGVLQGTLHIQQWPSMSVQLGRFSYACSSSAWAELNMHAIG